MEGHVSMEAKGYYKDGFYNKEHFARKQSNKFRYKQYYENFYFYLGFLLHKDHTNGNIVAIEDDLYKLC